MVYIYERESLVQFDQLLRILRGGQGITYLDLCLHTSKFQSSHSRRYRTQITLTLGTGGLTSICASEPLVSLGIATVEVSSPRYLRSGKGKPYCWEHTGLHLRTATSLSTV